MLKIINFIKTFLGLAIIIIFVFVVSSVFEPVNIRAFNYNIEISFNILVGIIFIFLFASFTLLKIWQFFWFLPKKYAKKIALRKIFFQQRQIIQLYNAIEASDIDEAKDVAKNIDKNFIDDTFYKIVFAKQLIDLGDFYASKEILKKIDNQRFDFSINKYLFLIAKNENNYDDALVFVERAIKIRPDSAWLKKQYLDFCLQYVENNSAFEFKINKKIEKYLNKNEIKQFKAMLIFKDIRHSQKNGISFNFEKQALKALELSYEIVELNQEFINYYIENAQVSKAQDLLEKIIKHHSNRLYFKALDKVFDDFNILERYKAIDKLITDKDNIENLYILAEFALKAQLIGDAKELLYKISQHELKNKSFDYKNLYLKLITIQCEEKKYDIDYESLKNLI